MSQAPSQDQPPDHGGIIPTAISGIKKKRKRSFPADAVDAFKALIAAQGGRVVGAYGGSRTPVLCICKHGHECSPRPTGVQQGRGMCFACSGRSSIHAAESFEAAIILQGGRVVGAFDGSSTPVHCICSVGHSCFPSPTHIQSGTGMCKKCANRCSEQAAEAFEASIVALGGRLVGVYTGAEVPVHCVCAFSHDCYPAPHTVQQGHGMCLKCAGLCPIEAAKAFEAAIMSMGGQVIGTYAGNKTPVHCVCAASHACYPQPNHIQQGQGMCRLCAPASYGEQTTRKALEQLGVGFEKEFRFKSDLKRYDFCIESCRVIIEYDGVQVNSNAGDIRESRHSQILTCVCLRLVCLLGYQHFKLSGYFMETQEDLLANQENDRRKQAVALSKGYRMMRFDYSWAKADPAKMAEKINWFIHESKDAVWVSDPELYRWLFPAAPANEPASPAAPAMYLNQES
jgi:very-short-patch-repair endonuclease